MKVTILKPTGYCAGVNNAIKIAFKARQEHPSLDVNVLGMLVHNQEVIALLEKNNIHTLVGNDPSKLLESVKDGSVIVFTAHGHDEKLEEICHKKHLIIYDAVCGKVKYNLTFIKKAINDGHQVIYIGEENHPEAKAALSISDSVLFYDIKKDFDYQNCADKAPFVIDQTTLNILDIQTIYADIKKHLPNAKIEDEICSATRERQEALLRLEEDVDAIIVVGDQKSSNTKRLFEIAQRAHPDITVLMIDTLSSLNVDLIRNKKHIAISSGASTPLETIDVIASYLEKLN